MYDDPVDTKPIDITDDDIGNYDNVVKTADNIDVSKVDVQMFETQQEREENKDDKIAKDKCSTEQPVNAQSTETQTTLVNNDKVDKEKEAPVKEQTVENPPSVKDTTNEEKTKKDKEEEKETEKEEEERRTKEIKSTPKVPPESKLKETKDDDDDDDSASGRLPCGGRGPVSFFGFLPGSKVVGSWQTRAVGTKVKQAARGGGGSGMEEAGKVVGKMKMMGSGSDQRHPRGAATAVGSSMVRRERSSGEETATAGGGC
ncbi:uncharacterized protein LOC131034953 [Cryptomeria japonica]|uniref:uncharacterized protein LOC131034953 n=1 Tax=Cryptomeria japonica TaxID=3369 RepID=UPI0027D9F507|nr:uncharacterized protein LOC131034953 [Cryptomeria japonica]